MEAPVNRRRRPGALAVTVTVAVLLTLAGIVVWWRARAPPLRTMTDQPSAVTLAVPDKSVAVLPFDNCSPDKESAYFADGMQDEILTDLAKVTELKVICRSSVVQYKAAQQRNVREIGKAFEHHPCSQAPSFPTGCGL